MDKEFKPEEINKRAVLYASIGGGNIAFCLVTAALAFFFAKFGGEQGPNAAIIMGIIAAILFVVGNYLLYSAYSCIFLSEALRTEIERQKKVSELYGK